MAHCRGVFPFNAGGLYSILLLFWLPPRWFLPWLPSGQSLLMWVLDPQPKHPGCHHCCVLEVSCEMACCWSARSFCCFCRLSVRRFWPATSSFTTFCKSAAPFTSLQVVSFSITALCTAALLGVVPSSSTQRWTSSLICLKDFPEWSLTQRLKSRLSCGSCRFSRNWSWRSWSLSVIAPGLRGSTCDRSTINALE